MDSKIEMPQRSLGPNLKVPALGLGCMGLSCAYGSQPDESDAIRLIHRAVDLGVNFLDTAEMYGPYKNEELLGKAIKGIRKKVIIATKFGFNFKNDKRAEPNSRPEHLKKVCDESLMRLKVDHIDLFYQHRVDPQVQIEETVGAMKDLVKAGKVLHLGLSEAGAKTIRRANSVHQLTALQSEYSLWERGIETDILPVLRELNIGFVAYSPLGRGLLGGAINGTTDLPAGDNRHKIPRFQSGNIERNVKLVERVKEIAKKKELTTAQLAIAWILHQGDDIVAIPGTTKISRLEENLQAITVTLSEDELAELDLIAHHVSGERFNPEALAMTGL